MRKLFLASFSFKTGDNQYEETDLICVKADPESRVVPDHAYEQFKAWFFVEYPTSELLSIVIRPGVGQGVSNHVPYPHVEELPIPESVKKEYAESEAKVIKEQDESFNIGYDTGFGQAIRESQEAFEREFQGTDLDRRDRFLAALNKKLI